MAAAGTAGAAFHGTGGVHRVAKQIGFAWALMLVSWRHRSPVPWCCAMPAAATSPASASPWAPRQFHQPAGRRPRHPHAARRNSPANSRVYNGCPGSFAAAGAVAPGAGRAVWPRARPAAGDGVVDLGREQWHQVPDPALPDRRDQRNPDRRSLFPTGRHVSQPPRPIIRCGKECSCRRPMAARHDRGSAAAAQRGGAIHQGFLVRESERAAVAGVRPGRRRRSPSRSTSPPSRCRTPTSRSCSSSTARPKPTAA